MLVSCNDLELAWTSSAAYDCCYSCCVNTANASKVKGDVSDHHAGTSHCGCKSSTARRGMAAHEAGRSHPWPRLIARPTDREAVPALAPSLALKALKATEPPEQCPHPSPTEGAAQRARGRRPARGGGRPAPGGRATASKRPRTPRRTRDGPPLHRCVR
jgi:hypothetical protein